MYAHNKHTRVPRLNLITFLIHSSQVGFLIELKLEIRFLSLIQLIRYLCINKRFSLIILAQKVRGYVLTFYCSRMKFFL